MGGGLMQLVAYGAQDVYLTGNPQITFFKVVYRRHTNFSVECIKQVLEGGSDNLYGKKVTSTIQRNGDLIHRMHLETTFTVADQQAISGNPGTGQINSVELEIGGQLIDKHTGHWLETYTQLTTPADLEKPSLHDRRSQLSRKIVEKDFTKINFGFDTSADLYQKTTASNGVSGFYNESNGSIKTMKYYVPLQFWFCRNIGLSLPLIALQYHDVKLKFDFARDDLMSFTAGAENILDSELWVDYIYLDTDERKRFAQVSHEYLIEQVQENRKSNNFESKLLNFNHPVKELIFTGLKETDPTSIAGIDANEGVNFDGTRMIHGGKNTPADFYPGISVDNNVSEIFKTTLTLKLNGEERFQPRKLIYFTRDQVNDYHSGFGKSLRRKAEDFLTSNNIGVYSFALKPEEHQPSGTCNFSRIDTAEIVLNGSVQLDCDNIIIYAVNYNVLRIMSGMGGLAYSN